MTKFITAQDKEKKAFQIKKLEPKRKMNRFLKWFLILISILIFLAVLILSVIIASDSFYDRYDITVQNPFRALIVVEDRQQDRKIISPLPDQPEVGKKKRITPTSKDQSYVPQVQAEMAVYKTVTSDVEIARYIASKNWDYSTAIRIAKSENFWNKTNSFDCTRVGAVNNDGTRDYGLWQINEIHIRSGRITQADALDCFKATDFAFRLYNDRENWSAWSAYNNGSYLNHSEIQI